MNRHSDRSPRFSTADVVMLLVVLAVVLVFIEAGPAFASTPADALHSFRGA